jgi:hypothetical protein
VQVQRSLLAHRDVAALVLRGRTTLEPERLLRQTDVDERVTALSTALVSGQWERAVLESDAMREDWALLTRQLLERSVGVAESEQAHRLLMEQTLQVIDLVADGSALHARGGDGSTGPALAVARALPRLTTEIAALAPAPDEGEGVGPPRGLDAAEAGLARTLGALNAALERPQSADKLLADRSATAGAAADRYFRLLRTQPGPEAQAAGVAALRAQFNLYTAAHRAAAAQLEARAAAVAHRRAQLLALMAGLLVLALGLGWRLAQALRAPAPAAPSAPGAVAAPDAADAAEGAAAPTGQTRLREEAHRLMQRLRDGPATRSEPAAAPRQRLPSPPPER